MRQHGWFRPHVRGLTAISSTTLREGGGDIITSIFADGTDGFYFDFSKTDRLFQDVIGTPADGAGENIYLGLESHAWAGRTYAGQVGAATEIRPTGEVALAGSATAATFNTSTGEGSVTRVDVSNQSYVTWPGLILGSYYRVDITVHTGTVLIRAGTFSSTGVASVASGSTVSVLVAGSNRISITNTTSAGSATFTVSSLKLVAGNHGLQATTSAQPKWQTGGLARFDGSDDNLLTTLVPGTSMTLAFKGTPNSLVGNRLVMGSNGVSGTSRIFLALDASGNFCGGVGADSVSTIKGSTNRNNTLFVGALTADGSTVRLYENGSVVYEAAQNGAINTTHAIAVGAQNAAGTVGTFYGGDLYHSLAIKKALTAAQIAAITNKWGTS